VETNPRGFDSQTFTLLERVYAPQAELDALIASDSELHIAASERAGVVSNGPDPLSYVYRQFEQELLPLPRVAAELGMTPEELGAQLPLLGGPLQALQEPGGSISRAALDEAYSSTWCILHPADRNRPVSCP
jgi:hypothetical protein